MKEYQVIGNAASGSIRFNTDSSRLEIYNGNQWWEIDATSPELQTGGTRGIWCGGEGPSSPAPRNTIQFVNVDSTGNAADFGDMSQVRTELSACASPVDAIVTKSIILVLE